jgi:hypothetical protein
MARFFVRLCGTRERWYFLSMLLRKGNRAMPVPARVGLLQLLLISALTAGPAGGQPASAPALPCDIEAEMERLAARMEALDAEHDFEARVGALCDAGHRDEAAALWQALEDALYAGPEGARVRDCMIAFSEMMRSRLAASGIDLGPDEEEHACDLAF